MKYVITGGPGVGKTTVCNELKKLGYAILSETARELIRRERPGGILPWTDFDAFQKRLITFQEKKEASLGTGLVFLDHSLIDIISYEIAISGTSRHTLAEEQLKGYCEIFLLDLLPEYTLDEDRVEDAETAQRIHNTIAQTYKDCGYDVINVPVLNPRKRALWILNRLNLPEEKT